VISRFERRAGRCRCDNGPPATSRKCARTANAISNLTNVSIYPTIDGAGTLHLFGVESPNGVQNVRHWWRPATR